MGFDVKILADSMHPNRKSRLVTMELTYPRIIHAEFMTHRQFSRNAASSRAIPVEKMLDRIMADPFIPIEWGTNQTGMVAGAAHGNPMLCEAWWRESLVQAHHQALTGLAFGLHKQIVNRLVEPWMFITVVATGVDHAWENFFKLRCSPDAEPHIRKLAYMARDVFDHPHPPPRELSYGDYHLPLTGFPGDEKLGNEELMKVSIARCARVSYLTHDGHRDVAADIKLFNRLRTSGHWSPFEHVAACHYAGYGPAPLSNFGGAWVQQRKKFVDEYCHKAPRPEKE